MELRLGGGKEVDFFFLDGVEGGRGVVVVIGVVVVLSCGGLLCVNLVGGFVWGDGVGLGCYEV